MENEEARRDEIAALSAIYADDWIVEDAYHFSLSLHGQLDTNKRRTLRVEFTLPMGYPAEAKPVINVSAPWMSRDDKAALLGDLNGLSEGHLGESVLYILAEQARQSLDSILERDTRLVTEEENANQESEDIVTEDQESEGSLACDITMHHGSPLVDRKSAFQAHLASVHSVSEAMSFLAMLKTNRKINGATHNMWAYRIGGQTISNPTVLQQNCDDDGETHAGSRLLHLLQIVDARDVMVVVSRWYGGIQLGPDRFKHISNVARELLLAQNYINSSK